MTLGPQLECRSTGGPAKARGRRSSFRPGEEGAARARRQAPTAASSSSCGGRVAARRQRRRRSRATSRASSRARCRSSWPAEALKAQAVAARSYALATCVKGKPFDLYSGRAQPGLLRGRGRDAVDDAAVVRRRPARSSCTRARSRRRTTSRPPAARPRAPPTSSARTSRISSSRRPVGQGLAVPPLGPGPPRRANAQSKLGADGTRRRRDRAPTPSGRLRSLVVQTTTGSRGVSASLSARRSASARRGSRSACSDSTGRRRPP